MAQEATSVRGELPRTFGRYVLFDHIGRGGMADIFLARARTELGGARLCVVKQILPHLASRGGFEEMLTAEAKLAAQLNHANVVHVFDLGRESDRLYIGMEYVEGFDLHQLLRRLSQGKVPLPAEFAIFIVREMLRALDYAHRARGVDGKGLGIVHRDVSPSNVLVSFEGEVKICDFGIARALRGGEGRAMDSASVAGKAAYMAPEHARGEEIDSRADVFAAGIILWELTAGRRLYKGDEGAMLALAQKGEVPALPDRGLPKQGSLEKVILRMLEPDPKYRYQTAGEALRDLEKYAASAGLMASPLRFGTFLTDHFADEIVTLRRAREQAAMSLTDSTESQVHEDPPPRLTDEEPGSQRSDSFVGDIPETTPSGSWVVDDPTGSGAISALRSGAWRLEAAEAATKAQVRVSRREQLERGGEFSAMWFLQVGLAALVIGGAVYLLLR